MFAYMQYGKFFTEIYSYSLLSVPTTSCTP